MEQRRFKVVEILALQSGTSERGEWRSQQVILEELQNVQFPDRYLVRFCGEKVAMLADLKANHPQVLAKIRDTKDLGDEAKSGLKAALDSFAKTFA